MLCSCKNRIDTFIMLSMPLMPSNPRQMATVHEWYPQGDGGRLHQDSLVYGLPGYPNQSNQVIIPLLSVEAAARQVTRSFPFPVLQPHQWSATQIKLEAVLCRDRHIDILRYTIIIYYLLSIISINNIYIYKYYYRSLTYWIYIYAT